MTDYKYLELATQSVEANSAEKSNLVNALPLLGKAVLALSTAAALVTGSTPAMAQAVRSVHDISSGGIEPRAKAEQALTDEFKAPDVRDGKGNVISFRRADPTLTPR